MLHCYLHLKHTEGRIAIIIGYTFLFIHYVNYLFIFFLRFNITKTYFKTNLLKYDITYTDLK